MHYNVLFVDARPKSGADVSACIKRFGTSYAETVRKIIESTDILNEEVFMKNAAILLSNFGMTRRGPFFGVGIDGEGNVQDPNDKLRSCWDQVGGEILSVKKLLNEKRVEPRSRTLSLLDDHCRELVISRLWKAFKKLLPVAMGEHTFGLVGASKILFSVFPEIVLPVDTAEWLHLFKTVDFGDITRRMAAEILKWEEVTGEQLQKCDPKDPVTTLPAVYNVMAMEMRP